jgi:TPR repeat protein
MNGLQIGERMKLGLAAIAVAALTLASAPASADFASGVAAYDIGDFGTAYNEWLPLAREGDLAAQRNIGHLYRLGRGVPQDFAVAANWYRRAAEKGLTRAQANLGDMYLRGQGVGQDVEEAATWFHRAATHGHVISQFNMGLLYQKGVGVETDLNRAMGWFHLAGQAGHTQANQMLTALTAQGRSPAPIEVLRADPFAPSAAPAAPQAAAPADEAEDEDVQAVAALEEEAEAVAPAPAQQQAAIGPDAEDEVKKGLLAYHDQDFETAFSVWLPVAEAGNADAQFFLGGLYMDGAGVEEDLTRAHAWLRLAAEKGHPKAKEFLALIRSIMTADQIETAERLSFTLAAN